MKEGNNLKSLDRDKFIEMFGKIDKFIKENYISKDKLKEKIEELEKEQDYYIKQDFDTYHKYENYITILKELLEDK